MKLKPPALLWGQLSAGDLVLVDSAPLICLLDAHPEFAPRFEGLFEAFEAGKLRIAISTIAMAEVLTGPLRTGHDALAKRYEKALATFEVVPVSQDIAVGAARLCARYGLKMMDALQAATALEISAQALATHDRDFSCLTDLKVLYG
jgi:predicted nucleic acid-binding protein